MNLVFRLGLTKEESLQQNVGQEEADANSSSRVPGESARSQRGPATRQRDGHFKRRSRPDLRARARRNLYKKQEPEEAAVAKDAKSVLPDVPLCQDGEAKTDSTGVSSAPLPGTSDPAPDPEGPRCPSESLAARVQPESDSATQASTSPDRVPSLLQEAVDQEPKDQKRKSFEQTASASFPEKKPRLEDRQSFRNTIASGHTEKPQPTKEEPKVPPIRVGAPWIPGHQIHLAGHGIVEPFCWAGAPEAHGLYMCDHGASSKGGFVEARDLKVKGIRIFPSSLFFLYYRGQICGVFI